MTRAVYVCTLPFAFIQKDPNVQQKHITIVDAAVSVM